jgi:hypothetical protein
MAGAGVRARREPLATGHFTWTEWATALGAELKAAARQIMARIDSGHGTIADYPRTSEQ